MLHLHALPSFSCKAFGAVLCFLPKLNRKYSMPACLTGSCLFPPLGPLVGFGLGFFIDLLGSSLDYGVEVHTTFSGSGCWASGCWVCGACLRLCSGIGLQLRRGMQKPLLRARDAPACTHAGARDSVCWALIGLLESVKQACNCSCDSTVRVSQKQPHLWYSAYLPVRRILHGCFCSGQQSTGTSLDVVFVCDDRTHQPHSNTTLWVLVHPMHCYGYGRQNDVHISVHTWIVKISLTGQGRQCYIILPSEDDIEHPLIVRSVFCKPRRHAPLNDSPAKWKCCSS